MSDKVKFHRMTRPMRFRRMRLFFKSVGHSYEVGVDKIKYLFNYVLYKLNILKRYRFTDCSEYPCDAKDKWTKKIDTKHFVGTLQSYLADFSHTHQDYFYYVNRKGEKKRTYTLVDRVVHEYRVISSLIQPGLKIDGKVYLYGDVPKIVQVLKEPKLKPVEVNADFVEKVEPEVVTYDLSKLLNLRYEKVLGVDYEIDVSYATVQHALLEAKTEFEKYLNSLTLRDIQV